MNIDFAPLLVALVVISAVVGWAVIEFVAYLFSFIAITIS